MNRQIQLFQVIQRSLLFVSKVPWILEPDVSAAGNQFLVLFALFVDLLAPHDINGLCELFDDVEFVEDQCCLRCLGFDRFDEGWPHIAADAFQLARSFRPEEVKEAVKAIAGPAFGTPDKSPSFQVIDIGEIHTTFLPGNLIDADVGYFRKVATGQPKVNSC